MSVQASDIVIAAACHLLEILSSVEKKEGPVLYQIHVGGILPFPDLKSQNVSVKTDHPSHVAYQQSESVQSHASSSFS